MLELAAALAAIIWILLLLLPWRPWSVREQLHASTEHGAADLSGITVLIPARDEAEHIFDTVTAVKNQGHGLRIIVIDDQSTDDTARLAHMAGAEVIAGSALPAGWTGKLWALQQGLEQTETEFILQLDADIHLAPGMLAALHGKIRSHHLAMVTIMALLPVKNAWQRLLLPAYVWFFKLLYPFALANGVGRRFAAAAGGCILLRRERLLGCGAYHSIAAAVIDDCALAASIKDQGGRIWIGLSRDVQSTRASSSPTEIGKLISRTAYPQLRHSVLLLLLTTLAMLLIFWIPVVALVAAGWLGQLLAAIALLCMWIGYRPLLRFYQLPSWYALALPLVAAYYLCKTWSSAWQHWRGRGSEWKQRHYR